MVYEESLMMSVDTTPNKKGARSLNSSASSVLSLDSKPLRGTWAEEVREEFGYSDESRKLLNSSNESSTNVNNSKREISLEFIDGANEKKFERLVKEEKLKTPFKRRHPHAQGNASRSNSPSSSGSDAGGGDKSNDGCRTSKFSNYRDEKRVRSNSYTSSSSSSSFVESNPAILERRQKQIDYGKNTIAYDRYIEMVPRAKRTRDHPQTPNKYGKYSRRAFDGLIKIWRKQLHYYDPPTDQTANGNDSSSDSDSD